MLESANQIEEIDAFSDSYLFYQDPNSEFYEEPSISLDENGFPQPLFNEQVEEQQPHKIDSLNEDSIGCSSSSSGSKDGSFAADFYQSGSDWSTLRVDSPLNSKKLKQKNLFQMWGLKQEKHEKVENEKNKDKENETHIGVLPYMKTDTHLSPPCVSPDSFRARNRAFEIDSKASQKRKSFMVQGNARSCPFYKKIPGTPFTVDAFRYGAVKGCSSYFLSHFHADHYGGLSKAWSHGPIYCTSITARLVRMCLYVNPSYIRPLELDVEHLIDGVKVTLLEANHCPGAALIYFHLSDGQRFLHTGDFRACKRMQTYPLLVNNKVNVIYLDTTYCNPKYRFPSKEEVTSFVVKTTMTCLKKQPKTLVVVGAYSIGKECVYIAISEAIKVKIYANASRRRILQSFDWPHLSKNLCTNGKDTPLHVLPISSLKHETLKTYLKTYQDQFNAVVAFRPTGWTFSESVGSQLDLIKPNSRGNIQIYGVPYSEHSSFTELQEFVQFLRPNKIIPTVNIGNAANREKQQSYFRQWLSG
ncbi:DNA cross-link repair protein SNM1-like [Chenopodium quinoa]|uniref:DNA repair metallo-beta-lactamase domain-containing protein n=1 Tax=Chenopodium quinoa TaxID=63459 RepID=A0A803NA70_CHEQI|nr:DNA cross-link repair protein SNM1-like [Chenopodium quinoa]